MFHSKASVLSFVLLLTGLVSSLDGAEAYRGGSVGAHLMGQQGSAAHKRSPLSKAHGSSGFSPRRRHHHRTVFEHIKRQPEAAVEVVAKRDDCVYGSWQCDGQALQRCYGGSYQTVRTCGDNTVCSTDPSKTGCIWPYQADESDSSSSAPSTDNSTVSVPSVTSSASTSTETSPPVDSSDSETNVQSTDVASIAVASSASASFTSASSTSSSSAAASTETSTPSDDEEDDGDDLCDDDGDDSEDYGDDEDNESSTTASSTATGAMTTDATSSVSTSTDTGAETTATISGVEALYAHGGHVSSSATSWTNTWWTPSASQTDAASTSWTDTWWTPSPSSTNDWSGDATDYTTAATSTTSRRHRHSSKSTSTYGDATATYQTTAATATATASTTSTSSSGSGSSSSSSGSSNAPHWVIYADNWFSTMPSASDLSGYNRFILAFWLASGGPADNVAFWSTLSSSEQQSVQSEYHAAGINLLISAFGSTESPTTNGIDATSCAESLAQYVKDNNLDGVDIDYEDDTAFNGGYAEEWLITFQTALRQNLPSPYIISHAPQAPWFDGQYPGGGYNKIHEQVGDTIDFYNVQFYNQGSNAYTTCDNLMFQSGSDFPNTSVMEINSFGGVPLEKIVLGKPLQTDAADNGYMDPSTLNDCITQGKAKGWNGGAMYWEYESGGSVVSTLLEISGSLVSGSVTSD